MAPQVFSEYSQPPHFQPANSRSVMTGGRVRNPARETYEKLSIKLKEQALPGVEFAEDHLFHLYRRNRRPNTIELNYTSIRLFLQFLKVKGLSATLRD